jgi:hypothetical protein
MKFNLKERKAKKVVIVGVSKIENQWRRKRD